VNVILFEVNGREMGRVELVAGVLLPSPTVSSVVASWLRLKRSPDRFLAHYDGWTNGTVTARRV
jgi:hypothetical protein